MMDLQISFHSFFPKCIIYNAIRISLSYSPALKAFQKECWLAGLYRLGPLRTSLRKFKKLAQYASSFASPKL